MFGLGKVFKDLNKEIQRNQEQYYSTRRKLMAIYLEDMRKYEAMEEKAISFSEKTYWYLKYQEVERKFDNLFKRRIV